MDALVTVVDHRCKSKVITGGCISATISCLRVVMLSLDRNTGLRLTAGISALLAKFLDRSNEGRGVEWEVQYLRRRQSLPLFEELLRRYPSRELQRLHGPHDSYICLFAAVMSDVDTVPNVVTQSLLVAALSNPSCDHDVLMGHGKDVRSREATPADHCRLLLCYARVITRCLPSLPSLIRYTPNSLRCASTSRVSHVALPPASLTGTRLRTLQPPGTFKYVTERPKTCARLLLLSPQTQPDCIHV